MLSIISRGSDITPLTLQEAKDFLRINWTNEDNPIQDMINAAVDQMERGCNLLFPTCTVLETYPVFPTLFQPFNVGYIPYFQFPYAYPYLQLARRPFGSLTSLQYYTSNNVLTAWTSYYLVNGVGHARLYFSSIPVPYVRPDAVQIEYTAGGVAPSPRCKQVLKLLVYDYYYNRGLTNKTQDLLRDMASSEVYG